LVLAGKRTSRQRVVVACEPGFWREANVIETCTFFNEVVYRDLQTATSRLRHLLDHQV
jgi:hypothetical protein